MKIFNRIVNITALLCGGFVFVAYASFFIKLIFWPEKAITVAACVTVLLCSSVALALIFSKKVRERLPGWLYNTIRYAFAAVTLFYSVTFIALCLYINSENASQAKAENLPEDTVFIVCGAGLLGESPGGTLTKRLDMARDFLEELPDSSCIVSGGQGPDEVIPESHAMQKYLVLCGIESDRIIVEDESSNTYENLMFSLEAMKENGLEGKRTVIISNAFHIPRIKLLCSRIGCGQDVALAPDPDRQFVFPTLVREYMSYAKLLLIGAE